MDGAAASVVGGMKKLTLPAAAVALTVAIAGCGGSSGGSSKSASNSTSVKPLVASSGLALYTPDGESASNVRCTGSCTTIWKPLRPGDAKLTGAAVIKRPDGTKQLATAGKPLYTFAEDTPGAVTGNGKSDAFGAKRFTWHVVTAGGKTAAAPATQSSGGGGYGSSGY
jgi:predicted lipoprotein with Yx(FWY)xxD motif